MSFIDQAAKLFGGTAEFKFQAALFGRNALYLEGAKPVKLDGDEMIFRVHKALIRLSGSDLCVKDISGDCVAVTGKIASFSVEDL